MESFKKIKFNDRSKLKISWLQDLSKKINLTPSSISKLEQFMVVFCVKKTIL